MPFSPPAPTFFIHFFVSLNTGLSELNLNMTNGLVQRKIKAYTDLGHIVQNIGTVELVLLGKSDSSNEYCFLLSIDAKQIGTSDSASYDWLNGQSKFIPLIEEMFPSANNITVTSVGQGRFRYLNCLPTNLWGYKPCTLYNETTRCFRLARVYKEDGTIGSYEMKKITVGNYGFDAIVFATVTF